MTCNILIGADEAGWGTLAGSLFVGATAANEASSGQMYCKDSKKYNDFEKMYRDISHDVPFLSGYAVVQADANTVVKNYGLCRLRLFQRVVAALRYKLRPRYPSAIIDGDDTFGVWLASAVPKADSLYKVVSAASCMAKAAQKKQMAQWNVKYPEYGFIKHAGYGSEMHVDALRKYGAIPGFHRIPIIAKMARNQGWTLQTRTDCAH